MSDDSDLQGSDGHVKIDTHRQRIEQSLWTDGPVRLELSLPDHAQNLLLDGANVNLNADVENGRLTLNIHADRAEAVSFDTWQAGDIDADDTI